MSDASGSLPGRSHLTAGGPITFRPARGRRRVLWAGLAAASAVALVVGGSTAWVRLASRGGIVDEASVPQRPVALVLGAGVYPDGGPQPFLAARLDLAARLWRSGAVSSLLLTGDGRIDTHDEPAVMRRYLLDRGVPDAAIVLDADGYDTYDSCVRARRVFGVEKVTLVSQTYHLPRALAICRAIGLDAIGVGDESMRHLAPAVWATGESRELPASVKAVWDVFTRRTPVLTPTPALTPTPTPPASP